MGDEWTRDLARLDPVQTRKRLADLIFEANHVADGLERAQGEGLREHVSITKLRLEKVAKEEITRLSRMLAEYRSGPPVADPAPAPKVTPPYDAYAAARARAKAKAAEAAPAAQPEPTPVPEPAPVAPPRPVLPPRPGMRLPPMTPRRSA